VEVIQQAPPLAHHHEQAPPRTVVLNVLLQMLRQMIYPIRQQSNLHVRRPGVAFVQPKPGYHFAFFHSFFFDQFL
jgi:hypothetical protein